MSEKLLDLIDDVINLALEEGVSLSDLRMAIHDRYINLDLTESGETE